MKRIRPGLECWMSKYSCLPFDILRRGPCNVQSNHKLPCWVNVEQVISPCLLLMITNTVGFTLSSQIVPILWWLSTRLSSLHQSEASKHTGWSGDRPNPVKIWLQMNSYKIEVVIVCQIANKEILWKRYKCQNSSCAVLKFPQHTWTPTKLLPYIFLQVEKQKTVFRTMSYTKFAASDRPGNMLLDNYDKYLPLNQLEGCLEIMSTQSADQQSRKVPRWRHPLLLSTSCNFYTKTCFIVLGLLCITRYLQPALEHSSAV